VGKVKVYVSTAALVVLIECHWLHVGDLTVHVFFLRLDDFDLPAPSFMAVGIGA